MYKGPTRKFKQKARGKRMRKLTEYGHQLLEKQKLRKAYNIREKALKNYVSRAAYQKTDIGSKLIELLERRLDNVVYRLGWAKTRPQAAQMVSHGQIVVNGKTVKIPSYEIGQGDCIEIKVGKRDLYPFRDIATKLEKYQLTNWLKYETKEKMKAQLSGLPNREHLTEPINLSAVLQFYSR